MNERCRSWFLCAKRRARCGVASVGAALACLMAVLAAATPIAAPAAEPASVEIAPIAEIRARQEVFLGSWHFEDETDRNWIRLRSRAGLRLTSAEHTAELVLNNEHRHYLTPSGMALDWDELIIENAFWRRRSGDERLLTIGRQNIVWPGGFLMMDGNPMDGSRSMYHNAVRVQTGSQAASGAGPGAGAGGFALRDGLDLALIYNPKRDPLVVIDDMQRPLCDADETALALRMVRGGWAWSLIYKTERDPDDELADLATSTMAARREGFLGGNGPDAQGSDLRWHAELAVQHQDGPVAAATRKGADLGPSGWAVAADGAVAWQTQGPWHAAAGAFFYSGSTGGLRPFRTPWGRWPKWSDMYIYSLMGENTDGRVHAAAWENIAAPHLTVSRPLGRGPVARYLTASVNVTYLVAQAPRWEARGLLTRSTLAIDLGPSLQGHLLWEMLVPGAFHDGRHDLPPLTRTVHFLRWQMVWSL